MKVENLNYVVGINLLDKFSLLDLVMWRKELKKDCERVIDRFIEFLSELNPEDLELFMEHTFRITNNNSDFKLPYSGCQM